MNFTSTFILFFPYLLTVITTLILYSRYPRLITYWNNNSSPYLNAGIILLISLFLSFEFFLFGKSSLMIIYDEGDTFFPLYKILAQNPNSDFFFSLSGGLYKNGIMFDTKFISLQVLLIKVFSPFGGYALIKFLNSFLVVIGFWLITKRHIHHTILLSIIYYGSLTYISTISIAHMSGYSAIPLTIFFLYQFEINSIFKKTSILIVYFIIIAISSSLPHSIMAHIGAILGSLFLYKIEKKNILFCIKGILLISIFSLINHLPVIDFVLNNKDILYRTSQNTEIQSFSDFFYYPINELLSKVRGSLIFIFGMFVITILGFVFNFKLKVISFVFPFILSILLDLLLSLEIFSFLKTLRSEMIMLSIPAIIMIALYQIFNNKKYKLYFLENKIFKLIVLFVFSFFLCDTKFTHFLHWQGEGSFKSNFILNKDIQKFMVNQKIISKDHKYLSNFRSVVIPTKLTPGLTWYHQINSLDGYSSFFPKRRAVKWMDVFETNLHNQQYIMDRYQIKFRNMKENKNLLDGKKINFLRSHGVRFYFSSVPLHEDFLKLRYKKSFQEKTSNFFHLQISNFYRNLRNMDFYIYEDFDYEPMINIKNFKNNFICNKKIIINKEKDQIKLDLRQCNELAFNQNYILSISLPNFEKLRVKQNGIFSYFNINKELKFVIPINFNDKQLSLKPIIRRNIK